ncbi:LysR family transcriptional regulator [Crenobacter cavernae]|uniref:LysR family transcriptional regulator n=1 Tax=Crenobacter cavernae TaxID=2290923 RepID=A0ABY0FD92_9NEIS|nr:LysR family transcriptional regulator [Crenobacter cavernae]RXZ44140.1 LysR family transcriptional regulator [Crenobacter cavernae]
MEKLGDLQLFCAAVEAGSLVAAGERLGASGAVVSKRLMKLEASLGVRLLQRTTRRLSTTPEGEAYYRRVRPLLDELAAADAELAAGRLAPSGVLRVTASASFGRRHVAGHLPAFLARYPQVDVQLTLTDTVLNLIDAGLDVAIRIGRPDEASWVARRLCPSRRVLVASSDYLARRGVPVSPADLADHDCLLLDDAAGARSQTWRFDGPDGPVAVKVAGRFSCNYGEAIGEACIAGGGVAIKAVWDVGGALADGRLVALLPDYALPAQQVYALYPSRRQLPAKVRAFVDFLSELYGDPPYWERGIVQQ